MFDSLRFRFVGLLAAAALGLGALGAAQAQSRPPSKTLVVGVAGFPDSLKTGWSSFTALTLSIQTNDLLVDRGADGNPVPALAERWEAKDDKTWRFYLRRGVKFHDGVEFTAEDVKFTIAYVLNPETKYGTASRIGLVERAEVVDRYTVDIVTKAPFPTLLIGLSNIVIEPKHVHEKGGTQAMLTKPIGTGPYMFSRWLPADRYELVANPSYWGGKPRIDRLVFRQIPEAATRVASLLAGETHIIEEVPVDLIPRIKSARLAELASVATSGSLVLTFDTRKPPFNDPRVRLAVDLAIDRGLINDEILAGTGEILQGQLLTKETFGFNPNLKARPYDPARAKQLLAEAGYPNGFATSITNRSGRYVSDVEIGNAIGGFLDKIGVRTQVNVVEGGVYSRMATAMDMGPMHMVGWYSLGDADFNTVWFTDASKRAFWKNDEYERLFNEARSTVDEKKRLQAYHRMMEIMHAENPAVFLYGVPSVYGKSKALAGWVPPSDRLLRLSKSDLK
jgi:peptide/nickel transport system substrate-binding protein